MIGQMCSVILCGFPFAQTMHNAYPNTINDHNMFNSEVLSYRNFQAALDSPTIIAQVIVRETGRLYYFLTRLWCDSYSFCRCELHGLIRLHWEK